MPSPASDVQLDDASLERPITELELPARVRDVLLGAGINTVGDVLAALERDEILAQLEGLGPKSLADLKRRLQEQGFPRPTEVSEAASEPGVAPEPAAEDTPEVADAAAPEAASEEIPSFDQPPDTIPPQPRDQSRFGVWLYGMIGLAITLLLFSLWLLAQLGIAGYTTLDADTNSISSLDGLTLTLATATDVESSGDRLRVQIKSVPRLEFLEGSAGRALRQAVETLPRHLLVKSPLYQIETRGNSSQQVMIDVAVPDDAEPWEILDLYTWTGEEWKWVGGELHTEVAGYEFLRAYVNAADVPATLVVVQAESVVPVVSTSLGPDDNPVAAASGVVNEVNLTGLLLDIDGGLVGDPSILPQPTGGDSYDVLPALRNWAPGASVNRTLLSDLLMTSEFRQAHVAHVVGLCVERGFAGVEVDYRGVGPDERDAYGDFVSALADALHAEGLRLSVVVEPPTPTDGSWDTGGYDWVRLGAAADAIKVPFPDDPAVYVEGGQAQRLLDWATAQVDRYKLHMLVSSLSAERSGAGINHISLGQALAPFGEAVALNPSDVTRIEPESQVEFGLSGRLLSITLLEAAGTYRLEYESDDGDTHTVWLGTATNLAAKLHWAQRYHLGGIVVTDMLDPGNAPGIVDAVRNAAAPMTQEMQVVWTVTSETATIDQQVSPLTEPGYTWTVLASNGDYTVRAAIAGFDHGSVPVTVGEPEPEVTETVTTTEEVASADEPTGGEGGDEPTDEGPTSEEAGDCLDASYVADVSIPDNTQLDNDEEFEKTWRVRNTGTCAWPEDTVIAFAGEAQMGAPDSVEVGAVEPDTEVEISVNMKAPTDAGRYTGIWQMKAAGEFFGGKLTVVILAGEVAVPVAVAPVSGGSFELGGHIRDTGHPYADKMHYTGMTWSKVQVHYGQDASGIIQAAHSRGFKIQLSALGSPDMVTRGGFEQDFANWAAQLAAAGADAIEVWNEPNIDREWQIGHISPRAYTNLLCTAYNAIKAANSGTAVISAAPAPTGSFGGGCQPNGGNCDDAPWMAGLRDAGAANCMDYIGAHHNSGATAPSARSGHPAGGTHHSWYFLPQTELYYNTFGGARKLFYTEMGYASQEGVPAFHDAFGWARGTDNAEQAAWLAEAVRLSVNTGMVRCIIVWNIDFVRYGYDPQDGYAIMRPDGSCPACETLHSVLGTR